MVYRVYVEKKQGQTHEADNLLWEIRDFLQITDLTGVRVLNRYDAENIEEELFRYAVGTVFSEPQVDNVSYELPQGDTVFAVEPLPGQYDQRADSAAQCIQIISQGERPLVKTARVYVLYGELTEMRQHVNGVTDRYYKFTLNLKDLRTGELVWSDEQEIRKQQETSTFGF